MLPERVKTAVLGDNEELMVDRGVIVRGHRTETEEPDRTNRHDDGTDTPSMTAPACRLPLDIRLSVLHGTTRRILSWWAGHWPTHQPDPDPTQPCRAPAFVLGLPRAVAPPRQRPNRSASAMRIAPTPSVVSTNRSRKFSTATMTP